MFSVSLFAPALPSVRARIFNYLVVKGHVLYIHKEKVSLTLNIQCNFREKGGSDTTTRLCSWPCQVGLSATSARGL